MHKLFIQFAAISGALSVALGAFGAHALKERLTQCWLPGHLSDCCFLSDVSYAGPSGYWLNSTEVSRRTTPILRL